MQDTRNKLLDHFTVINTNARSLKPKMNSFVECFKEMEAHVAIVTETWLQDGLELEDLKDDLLHERGLG